MINISVITICYNDKDGLIKTINSVQSQIYEDYEHIIIDGGSLDGTLKLLKEIKNEKCHWISERDKGIYDAMNKGIKMAKGEWLIMLNAGDVFADSYVLEKVFSSSIPDNINVLYSDYYRFLSNGKRVKGEVDLINRPSFNHQNTIYRKRLHEEHGYYVVTQKIIISDILFFYQIPVEQMLKVDTVIAIFESGGISSQGTWSLQQWLCADVVFRRRTFSNMVWTYYLKKIKSIIPNSWKDILKNKIGIIRN